MYTHGDEPDLFLTQDEVDRQKENAFFKGWGVGCISGVALAALVLWAFSG